LLGALARSGLLQLSLETFRKDGKEIEFRRATITDEGRRAGSLAERVLLPIERPQPKRSRKGRKPQPSLPRPDGERAPAKDRAGAPAAGKAADTSLLAALKAWRLDEARRKHMPAFRILSDRALQAIAASRPRDGGSLLSVHGVGPKSIRQYGAKLLEIIGAFS
jgi:DNA topoisomerase-3